MGEEINILKHQNEVLKKQQNYDQINDDILKLKEENESLRVELNKEKENNNFLLKNISDAEQKAYQFEEVKTVLIID